MKRKRGRPELSKKEYKGVLFAVRVAKPEADKINGAIKRSGKAKPDWLREVLIAAS